MNASVTHNVVLGVSGGIAAYKSADLCRRLTERGARVRVVMTRGAQAFITPLTFQAVSGNPVHTELLDDRAEAGMGHIELARWADLVLVAPATANLMARLAAGMADDLLTTLCLATRAPIALAPAMNQQMWAAAATRDNARVLAGRGVWMLGPDEGDQACGEVGPGRMLEPREIAERVRGLLGDGVLSGLSVLVTAGPTREAIDPVRFISNHSSGKMGYAVAGAAAEAGARVTLVSGPTNLDPPPRVERVEVESCADMHQAVMQRIPECQIFIGAAAVADYRPSSAADQKIKKTVQATQLELVRTEDVLAAVSGLHPRPFTVGFAAETERVEDNARSKLNAKRLDMIAANQVGLPGRGFNSEHNALTVFWPDGQRELPLAAKPALARDLVSLVAERFHASRSA
jgi:phosphopantothenoylcysteine decarboxylase/phosphopantothenate--cysteine ligase